MPTMAQNKARLADLDGKIGTMRKAYKEAGSDDFDILAIEDGVFETAKDADDAQTRRLSEYASWTKEARSLRELITDLNDAKLLEVETDDKADAVAANAASSARQAASALIGQADLGKAAGALRGMAMINALCAMEEVKEFRRTAKNGVSTPEMGEDVLSWLPERRQFSRALATWEVVNPLPTELVRAVRNNVDFLATIPRITLGSGNAWQYYRQNTRTNAAAPVELTGSGNSVNNFPESTFTYEEVTALTRSIGHYWPVMQEQLDDVGMLESELELEGTFGVLEALMTQVLTGTGTGQNLTGLNTIAGANTEAKGASESIYAVIQEVMGEVEANGRVNTDFVVMHPTDFWRMRGENASGIFFAGPPTERGLRVVDDVDIITTTAQTANTATLGSYRYLRLIERMGVRLDMTDAHASEFIGARLTMRAWGRYALAIMRPASIGTVTGLNT